MEQLAARLDEHNSRNAQDFQRLKDILLAQRVAERVALFGDFLNQPRVVPWPEVGALLDSLVAEGLLTHEQARQALCSDLIVAGRHDDQAGYLVVETSWTIGSGDVDRARRRADYLRQAGLTAWPAVLGYRLSERAAARLDTEPIVQIVPGPDGDLADEEPG